MKNILIALVLLWTAGNCFSQEQKSVSFTDQTRLEVVNASRQVRARGKKTAALPKVSVASKEFTAVLTGSGKAVPPLDDVELKSLAKKNQSLAAQIKRLDSSYNLSQDGAEYYFAGLNSVASDKLADCSTEKPCQVRCRAYVIRLSSKKTTENVVILCSLEFIK